MSATVARRSDYGSYVGMIVFLACWAMCFAGLFFAYAVVLTWQMMQKMGNYKMTIIDLPMNSVYAVCAFGFACAAVRAVQVAVEHWRQGYSVLERPEIAIEETL